MLTQARRHLCVRNDGKSYRIRNDQAIECASCHAGRNDRGSYVPLASALYIAPIPTWWRGVGPNGQVVCSGGEYSLNIKPTANDSELHASVGTRSGEDQSPADPGTAAADVGHFLAGARQVLIEESRPNPGAQVKRLFA